MFLIFCNKLINDSKCKFYTVDAYINLNGMVILRITLH
jgi:hypothetical protein